MKNLGFFAVAAFLILVHPFDERIANARVLTPLRYCGQMCYSLYLVHFPVVFFLALLATLAGFRLSPLVSIPVCGAMAIAASWQFHVYVERRFLNTPVGARTQPAPSSVALGGPQPSTSS